MNCINLPGITAVTYIPTDSLPADLMYQALSGCTITLDVTPTEIALNAIPVCDLEQSPDNNTQIEKVKLTFTTLDDIPTQTPLAFEIKTVSGGDYIIGTRERPYPTIKTTTNTSTPEGDPAVTKYEVTFTARKALISYKP